MTILIPTLILLEDFHYSYDYTPDEGSPNCPRCGGGMWVREHEYKSDCGDCGLIADLKTDECFEVIK